MVTVTALRGRLVECLTWQGKIRAGGIRPPGEMRHQGEGRGRGVCGLVTLSDVVRTMRPLFPGNSGNNQNNNYHNITSSSSNRSYNNGNGNKIGGGNGSMAPPQRQRIQPHLTNPATTTITATAASGSIAVAAVVDRGVVVLDTIYLPLRGFDTRSLTVPLLVLVRVVNHTLLPIFDVSVGVNHVHNEEEVATLTHTQDSHATSSHKRGPTTSHPHSQPHSHHHHHQHHQQQQQQQQQRGAFGRMGGHCHVGLTTRSGRGKMIPPLGTSPPPPPLPLLIPLIHINHFPPHPYRSPSSHHLPSDIIPPSDIPPPTRRSVDSG